jgi:protein O-mannosyl-transferase
MTRTKWYLALGLLIVTLAAYWNSFHAPFVFDDLETIQRNTSVRFGEFTHGIITPRAILYKTFTLNFLISRQEVWSYHLLNFILHFLNGLLLFAIALRIPSPSGRGREARVRQGEASTNGEGQMYAALAAAFFLLHPVQTESVTYISSRSELLSTFFYLAGFLIFVLWPRHRVGVVCSLAVGVAYFLGLGSKETVVTLPASICLYDYLFLSNATFRPILSRWRFYALYIIGASAAIYYLLEIGLKDTLGSKIPGSLSRWPYFLTETRVLVHYVRLIFVPIGLNLDYDFRPSFSIFDPAVLGSISFLSSLVVVALWLRRRAPIFSFSILWFFITLSPTSSIVPIVDVIFEHRLYLPLAGVALSFPFLIEFLQEKLIRLRVPRAAVPVYSSIVLMALLVTTVGRNYVWGDEIRLFTDVLAKSPGKQRPYNALAFAYLKRGDFDGGIAVVEQGLQKIPSEAADLSDTLANLCLKAGQFERAIDLLERTTHLVSGDRLALAYNNLGVAYLYLWTNLQNHRRELPVSEFGSRKENILKPAAVAFSKALEFEPGMPSALDSYVNVMSDRGRSNEVESAAEKRLAEKETFEDFYVVGKVAFNNGAYARAVSYFERAENIKTDVRIVYFNHAYALKQLRQEDGAIDNYIKAIRVDPIFTEAHFNLGLIYMSRQDYAKARDSFIEVLRLDPKNIDANLNLASIHITLGNRETACKHLSTVLAIAPDNQTALAMARQLGCVE